MPKSVRQILLDYAMRSGGWNDKSVAEVDTALEELREMILSHKRDMSEVDVYAKETYNEVKYGNMALDKIAEELK